MSRHRCSRPGAAARRRSSSGPAPPESRRWCGLRARPAGPCRSSPDRPGRIPWCVSAWPITPSGSTGLTFVSFRITSEVGPKPFATYRAAYEKKFGAEQVGVEAGGRPVLQPPDWSTYSYDAVKLSAAALETKQSLLTALDKTVITGANGDERGFGPTDREGGQSGRHVLRALRGPALCSGQGRHPVHQSAAGAAVGRPGGTGGPSCSRKAVMCGRYASSRGAHDLASWFDVEEPVEQELPPLLQRRAHRPGLWRAAAR